VFVIGGILVFVTMSVAARTAVGVGSEKRRILDPRTTVFAIMIVLTISD
jgi:hypothetical protein